MQKLQPKSVYSYSYSCNCLGGPLGINFFSKVILVMLFFLQNKHLKHAKKNLIYLEKK